MKKNYLFSLLYFLIIFFSIQSFAFEERNDRELRKSEKNNLPIPTSGCWKKVSAGVNHTLAIAQDGTLWAWGRNDRGQLGIGNYIDQQEPIQVGTDSNWKDIGCGESHSLALKTNGTLWSWGAHDFGQLGLGTLSYPYFERNLPNQIGAATNWTTIACGYLHNLALNSNNELWAWGKNDNGQLGNGTRVREWVPIKITHNADNWISIAAGRNHSLGVKSNGNLLAWGDHTYGQLGIGNNFFNYEPTQVGNASNWDSVYAGSDHSIVLKRNGTLWSFGRNASGQLGLGTTTDENTPVQIGNLTSWKNISAGGNATLAIKTDNSLWAWGFNAPGQLGLGDTTNRTSPTNVGTATNWDNISCGDRYSTGIKSNGELFTWGDNAYGKLGLNDLFPRYIPFLVSKVPIIITVISPIYYNQGETAIPLTAASNATNFDWWYSQNGGTSYPVIIPSTTNIGSTSYWVSAFNNYGCIQEERKEIVVIVRPNSPTTNWATQIYTGDNKTISNLQITGSNIIWYDAPTGGNILPDNTLLNDDTTYYASQTINSLESSDRLAITVKRISDNTQNVPYGNLISDLIVNPSIGYNVQFYTVSSGGTTLPSNTILDNGVYYIEQYSGAITSNRVPITVDLFASIPSTNWFTQIYTGDDKTLSDLQIIGTAIKWYDAPSGGNLLPSNTSLIDESIYYATQTINSEESTNRLGITVNRISDNSQVLLPNSSVSNLISTPSNGTFSNWFSNSLDVSPLSENFILNDGQYFIEQLGSNTITINNAINYPDAFFKDASGIIYLVDSDNGNSVIKKMNSDGSNLQVIVGGFSFIDGIVLDQMGNIYVSDMFNNTILKMNNDGSNIQTIATGFNVPRGLSIDAFGNIYIADRGSNSIKKMNNDGSNIQTISNSVTFPNSVYVDSSGVIYVTNGDNSVVKMDNNGANLQILGSGFLNPHGVFTDSLNRIYIADGSNNVIKIMNNDGSNVQIIASGFSNPYGIFIDDTDNVFVLDRSNKAVKKITPFTSNRVPVTVNISPVAPTTTWQTQIYTGDDKTLDDLQVTGTNIKWYDASSGGNLLPNATLLLDEEVYYASQSINNIESIERIGITVNKISDNTQYHAPGNTVSDLISTPSSNYAQWFNVNLDGNPLNETTLLYNGTYFVEQVSSNVISNVGSGFSSPLSIFIDNNQIVYIADHYNNRIKKMNIDGSNIQVIRAGIRPSGIYVDSSGTIYFTELFSSSVMKMNNDGTNLQTILNGFTYPRSIYVDSLGKIYVTDNVQGKITKMDNDGTNAQIIGAGFSYPAGIFGDLSGNIYVADAGNSAIKKMNNDGANLQTIFTGYSCGGIYIDSNNHLYATTNNNKIIRMNIDGSNNQIIATLSNSPNGIALDNDNNIFVSISVAGNGPLIKISNQHSNRVPVDVIVSTLSNTNFVYDNTIVVFKNQENLVIRSDKNVIKNVAVYDILGRVLANQNVGASETKISGLPVSNQIVVVHIKTEKGIVIRKVLF